MSEKNELDKKAMLPMAGAAAGNIIWGVSFLFSRIAIQSAAVEVTLSMRFILAFLLMHLMVVTGREKITLKGRNLKPLILLCISEPIYFYFETFGIYYTNATFAGVVLAAVPVVSLVVALLLLKEYPTRRQAIFSVLPVIGVILMTISGSEMGVVQPVGVVLLVLCCVASAGYKVANRKSSEGFSTFERTYFVQLACAIVFTIDAVRVCWGDPAKYFAPLSNPLYVAAILFLSIFCSVVAGMFVNYAAARMSVVKLATFGTISTVCAAFAGVIFLDEPISAMSLAGTVLIIYGIRQVTKPEAKE